MSSAFKFIFLVYLTSLFSIFSFAANPGATQEMAKVNVMTAEAQRVVTFFNSLNKDSLHLADEFYDENVEFQDPIHQLKGSKAIKEYYGELYKNAEKVHFEFTNAVSQGSTHVLVWNMHLKTNSLNSGKEFSVTGNSLIIFGGKDNKVIYHRDYFDMGEFVYERVPVLKNIINFIKQKMSGGK